MMAINYGVVRIREFLVCGYTGYMDGCYSISKKENDAVCYVTLWDVILFDRQKLINFSCWFSSFSFQDATSIRPFVIFSLNKLMSRKMEKFNWIYRRINGKGQLHVKYTYLYKPTLIFIYGGNAKHTAVTGYKLNTTKHYDEMLFVYEKW